MHDANASLREFASETIKVYYTRTSKPKSKEEDTECPELNIHLLTTRCLNDIIDTFISAAIVRSR